MVTTKPPQLTQMVMNNICQRNTQDAQRQYEYMSDLSSHSFIHSSIQQISPEYLQHVRLCSRWQEYRKKTDHFCLHRVSNLVILMIPLKKFCFKNVGLSGNMAVLQPINRSPAPLLHI